MSPAAEDPEQYEQSSDVEVHPGLFVHNFPKHLPVLSADVNDQQALCMIARTCNGFCIILLGR